MNQERMQAAVRVLIQNLMKGPDGSTESWILVPSPICRLDQESYELLVKRTDGGGYSYFFTDAVRAIKPVVSIDQLKHVISAVKKNRSGYRSQTVNTKLGKLECKWVKEMAATMQVKPARVMEAVIFLYLRAEDQKASEEN